MEFLSNEWIAIPLFGAAIFIFTLKIGDRVVNFLAQKSLGKRPEILKLLHLMGNDVSEKKVTWMMLLISFGFSALLFLTLWPNLVAGSFIALVMSVVGWHLPYPLVKMMYEKRCGAFVDQMVDGLTIMANGIKAGSNPQESMRRVVEIMGNPIRSEFTQVLHQMQLGDSFESALTDLGMRIPIADVQMFVTAINILKETGGNLAETFETIVITIRERQKVEKKIQALTAQGLMQGIIITLIPFILMAVFMVVDPNFIKPMFTTTLGLFLVFMMLGLQVIGGIMIKKVVTIKV